MPVTMTFLSRGGRLERRNYNSVCHQMRGAEKRSAGSEVVAPKLSPRWLDPPTPGRIPRPGPRWPRGGSGGSLPRSRRFSSSARAAAPGTPRHAFRRLLLPSRRSRHSPRPRDRLCSPAAEGPRRNGPRRPRMERHRDMTRGAGRLYSRTNRGSPAATAGPEVDVQHRAVKDRTWLSCSYDCVARWRSAGDNECTRDGGWGV